MRVLKLFVTVYLAFCFSSCSFDLAEGTPACLREKINEFKKESLCSELNVSEFLFQEETVYVLGINCCCDRSSEVVNAQCEQIGFLGGFQGNNIINGEEFANATLVRVIWEK